MNLPPKKDVARALLLSGSVFIHLDPRLGGVMVPEWLKHQPQLVLQIGLDLAVPIPDLKVDDKGVYGTLSFNRSPYTCLVPWDAIFALAGDDGRGMVWPESMPPEITAEVEREAGRRAPPPPSEDALTELSATDSHLGFEEEDNVIRLRPHGGEASGSAVGRDREPSGLETEPGFGNLEDEPPSEGASEGEGERSEVESRPPAGLGRKVQLPPYLKVIK